MKNPANGGVSECRTGWLDTPDDTRKFHEPQAGARVISDEVVYQPCSDECCYRLARALRAGRISRDSWAHGFTLSLLRHNKRRSWIPSPKQLRAMRALVAELSEDTGPLIDDGGEA